MKTKILLLTIILAALAPSLAVGQWATSGSNIYNTNSGNVGVGTSSPTYKLDVVGNGTNTEIFAVRNEGTNLLRIVATGAAFDHAGIIMSRSRGTLSSPTALLANDRVASYGSNAYVNGAFRGTANIDMYLGSSPGVNSNPGYMVFKTTPNNATSTLERMRITEAGNVGIGITSPSYLLHVNGNVGATGYITTSDKRFKENIKKIETPMEKLSQLEGYTYVFNRAKFANRNFPEGERTGLIAQEVQKVFPNLVLTDAEGYLGVDYNGLIPILLEAIKELKREIDFTKEALAEKMANSDKEISTLETKGIFLRNYPNPAKNVTNIEYSTGSDNHITSVILHNFQGKEIKTFTNLKHGKGNIEIDTSELSPGIYFCNLILDGKLTITSKVLVTK